MDGVVLVDQEAMFDKEGINMVDNDKEGITTSLQP